MPKKPTPNLREDLCQAAAKEFAEKGFHQASMESIGQRLGMTKGAVYRHFSSKHELFRETFHSLQTQREELFQSQLQGGDPLEQLEALLRCHLAFHFQNPEFHRLLWILETELRDLVATALGSGIRSEHRALRAKIRSLLRLAARQGQIDVVDPAAQAFQLASLLEGSQSQSFTMAGDIAPFLHEEDLVQNWLAPLRNSAKRRKRRQESHPPQNQDDSSSFQPPF
jgi:AcrR family transcriptional regulator